MQLVPLINQQFWIFQFWTWAMGDSTDRTDVVAPGQLRRVLDQRLPGGPCSEHTTSLAIFRWGHRGRTGPREVSQIFPWRLFPPKGLDEGAENLTGFRHGPNLDGSLPRIKEKAIMTYRFGLKDWWTNKRQTWKIEHLDQTAMYQLKIWMSFSKSLRPIDLGKQQ